MSNLIICPDRVSFCLNEARNAKSLCIINCNSFFDYSSFLMSYVNLTVYCNHRQPIIKCFLIKKYGLTLVRPINLYCCFPVFCCLIFLGVELLYYVTLVCAVQQSESALHTHMSLHFWISFPFRSPQSTGLV